MPSTSCLCLVVYSIVLVLVVAFLMLSLFFLGTLCLVINTICIKKNTSMISITPIAAQLTMNIMLCPIGVIYLLCERDENENYSCKIIPVPLELKRYVNITHLKKCEILHKKIIHLQIIIMSYLHL